MKSIGAILLFPGLIYLGFILVSAKTTALPADEKNYEVRWKKVDSLENKGLLRLALAEVHEIFNLASKEKSHNQVIKSVLYELKFNTYLEEDDYVLGINRLNDLIEDAPSPSKEILHSLAAEVYWGYYSANVWKFSNRSNVIDADLADIRTWDLERIAEKVVDHYYHSLLNQEISQRAKIETFAAILNNAPSSKELRPTLYDFLSFRAIDFFASNTFNLGGNAETFSLKEESYFGSNSSFVNQKPTIIDSLNTKFWASLAYQQLTKFRGAAKDQTALIHVELNRLLFVRGNSNNEAAEDMFYAGLQRMTNVYTNNKGVAEVWYEIAKYHSELANSYNFLGDSTNRWEKKRALEICNETISKFPNSYGADQCLTLINQLQTKTLSLNLEDAEAVGKQGKVRITYKNIDEAHLKIVKVENSKFWEDNYRSGELEKYIKSHKAVQEKKISLVNPGDYLSHSTEVSFDGLEHGYYYLLLSSDGSYDTENKALIFAPFWVTNLTFQSRAGKDENEIIVFDRLTGKPVANAGVKITYKKYNYKLRKNDYKVLGNFVSDDCGEINYTPNKDVYSYQVEVKTKDDFYAPKSGARSYYSNRTVENNLRVNLFTDRKIYRPGQSIYFKGIAINHRGKERELFTESEITISFKDNNYQEIAKKTLKTNEYGSFEGTFKAPFGVLTGQMSITTDYGSTSFRVEEYKRPKFMVEMNPIQGEFKVNDSIQAIGVATAYAGNKIDGATVKYRITRSTNYYNRWWYWGWYPQTPPKEITQGEIVTDENGEFKIDFKAFADESADKKNLPMFTYTIQADVTDINGETHSTSTTVIVGYQSLLLSNNLPDEIENNAIFNLRVSSTNLSGEKLDAKGAVTIFSLKQPNTVMYDRPWDQVDMKRWSKEEFKTMFPGEIFENENAYETWAKDKAVLKANFNTAKTDTIKIENFKKWKPGIYCYQALSKDKNGYEIKDLKYFTVYNKSAQKIPTNEPFWAKQMNTVAEPGEVAEIIFGTATEQGYVKLEVEHDGEIVESKIYNLKKEQVLFSHKILEKYRGGITIHLSMLKNKHYYSKAFNIHVPYTNKELDLKFETFRNKLKPGDNEEWIISIQNKQGGKEQAELLATLYDQSLDALYTPNDFYLSIYSANYARRAWSSPTGLGLSYGYNKGRYWNSSVSYPSRYFPSLDYYGYSTSYYGPRYYRGDRSYKSEGDLIIEKDGGRSASTVMLRGARASAPAPPTSNMNISDNNAEIDMELDEAEETVMDYKSKKDLRGGDDPSNNGKSKDLTNVKARTNFNETAFFYPQLAAEKDGTVKVKFTIPESLTKWTFLGLAHTKDLKIGTIREEVVTQKELMVVPNIPRFLREGDKITLSTKISNVSEEMIEGAVQIFMIDPFTEKPIDEKFKLKKSQQSFAVEKGRSTMISWEVDVPYNQSAVKYKIVASGGKYSDGEENVLPILSNRMLVTESMPMPIRGKETKKFAFDKLVNSGKSKTLRNHRFTLEFTSNPAWYALQAMPYMMEYPHECSEQVFTRFYSNSIATHIMNSSPKIKQVIKDWGENSPEAFLSNLQKNQELKAVMLEETPWVLNAKSEEQTKRNLSILLDMDRMSREMEKALGKVIKAQTSNGGWPWFPGMKESRYITQHIITGMGHLDHLGIKSVRENKKTWKSVKDGIDFLDNRIVDDYNHIMRYAANPEDQHIGYTQIQYLYTRSYFPELGMNNSTKKAVEYFKNQAEKYWLKFNIYAKGMLALAGHRFEMKELATDIVKSLKDRSIHTEEFGMYWKDYHVGYRWYEAPIETQALMIEMFDEVTNDQESVEELKIWLLKEKQTTHWKTTKQTTEAVYALLLKGTDLLANDELVEVTLGGKKIKYVDEESDDAYAVKAEAGTGYFKTHWAGESVKPAMGNISITKNNSGVAWGAAYWQYFEDLDKITFAETNLKLEKKLFLVEITPNGEKISPVTDKNVVRIGDKLRVRIELRTDRNLEYVHMKDMRASGFEPISVLSRYKYQDGLGYYESTKDAATHFFFDYVPKGTYVFEYDMRVQHKGDFSNGITTIQCMYAPEFTSHSEGLRVIVE